ncbi:LysR family transcriptional regulator [Halomonas elongata]|uniref:LysR family transcriptional regulator n=1 Tax=Halomonas elongata TaxID=2746 RepID=UPI00255A7D65|nr:LysR family transcriptional regulator [Halomonas elongata]MDL4861013.1 LysR family transcriptional regulator [Halomonas elongata]
MALTFRQLRYFLVLSDELHFGQAAKRLHISQPPLSASLRQLEEDLGTRLLDRNSKHVTLTPAGEIFQRQARRLLEQLEDSRQQVKRAASSPSGLLKVGFTPAMIFRCLPRALDLLQEQQPGIDIKLIEKNSANQVEAVSEGQIDIGFIHSMPLPEGLDSLMIADEPFLCCLPAHHHMARRTRVSLNDLRNEPMVMFGRDLAPHYYDRILSLFRVASIEPRIYHEVSHWLTIVALVARGMGTALVPRSLAQAGISNVVFIPLDDARTQHQSHCIWSRDIDNPGRDLLIDCVRTSVKDSEAP